MTISTAILQKYVVMLPKPASLCSQMSHSLHTRYTRTAPRENPKKVKAAPKPAQKYAGEAARAYRAQQLRMGTGIKPIEDIILAQIQKKSKFSPDQFLALVGPNVTTDLKARAALHATTDPLVENHVQLHKESVQAMLGASVEGTTKFLNSGAWGIAATAVIPGIALPVVLKFAAVRRSTCCMDAFPLVCADPWDKEGRLACTSVTDLSSGWPISWTGGNRADRERVVYEVLSHIEHDAISPHFLHVFLGASTPLQTPTTMAKLGEWLQAPPAKMAKFEPGKVRELTVNVMEYGGDTFGDIIDEVLVHLPAPRCLLAIHSGMIQVFHALLAMVSDPSMMRHNDCHIFNVLVAPTRVSHLHYQVLAYTDATRTTVQWVRYFRVPTFGMRCRVMDFGLATSLEFGPQDHGTMARFAHGGPQWKKALDPMLQALPLETYDAARIIQGCLDKTTHFPDRQVHNALKTEMATLVKEVCKQGKAVPTTKPIKEAHKFRESTVKDIQNAAKVTKQINMLQDAMVDHGVFTALFVHAAEAWGYECDNPDPCPGTFDDKTVYIVEVLAPPLA